MDPLAAAPPRHPRDRRCRRRRVRVLADRPPAGEGPGGIHAERREPRLRGRRRVHHRVPGGEAHLRAAPADSADAPQRDHRGGGRALLLALRGRRPGHPPRRLRELPPWPRGGRREHHHPAARQGALPHARPELLPQDQGSPAGVRAREAVLEGPAARALPQPGLHGPRRVRRRGGGPDVLRQVGPGSHSARGLDARRAPSLPGQLLALRATRAGPAAAGHRGRPAARARVHQRGRGQGDQPRAARPGRLGAPAGKRPVLPRVPPAEPRGEVRERRPLQERPRHLHHPRSGASAGGGAGPPGRDSSPWPGGRAPAPPPGARAAPPPSWCPRGRSW